MDIPRLRDIFRHLNTFDDIDIYKVNDEKKYTYVISGRIGEYSISVFPRWITIAHNGITISALTDEAACDIIMDMIAG